MSEIKELEVTPVEPVAVEAPSVEDVRAAALQRLQDAIRAQEEARVALEAAEASREACRQVLEGYSEQVRDAQAVLQELCYQEFRGGLEPARAVELSAKVSR